MANVKDLLHGYAYQELLEVSCCIQETEQCAHGLADLQKALNMVGSLVNGGRDGLGAWVFVLRTSEGKVLKSREMEQCTHGLCD